MERPLAPLAVPFSLYKLGKAREKLLALRSLGPTVYGDQGQFAKHGVDRHEKKVKQAEIDVGLWEGRWNDGKE